MNRRAYAVLLVLVALSFMAWAGEDPWGKAIPAERLVPTLEEGLQLLAQVEPERLGPLAEEQGLALREGRVTVVVETAPGFSAAAVARLGGRVVHEAMGLAEVSIAPQALTELAELRGVAFVRRPYPAVPLALSEGVPLTGAPAWHEAGIKGRDVRVAVIDIGFSGLSTAINTRRLPNVIHTVDYTGTGMETGGAHGTACAEIVRDMAPEAELLLFKIANEVHLAQAVEEAVAWGVTVISHSVGWFNTNFYDGTGVIADIVRRATRDGILWVNAAGNHAAGPHWVGTWSDTSGSGFLEFVPGVEVNRFQLRRGETVHIWLTWDAWPTTDQDYDLYLVDAVRGVPVMRSTGYQSGWQPPYEYVSYTSVFGGTYGVAIEKVDAPERPDLQLFLSSNVGLEYPVAERSVVAPGNAAETFTVGAVDWRRWTTGPQEPFSSQGPTSSSRLVPAPRIKPDLVAPNRVATTSYGREAFVGTSAAAPHVAGAAALLLSANPHWSVTVLRSYLLENAVDMGRPGRDTVYGSGRLRLGEPLAPPPTPPADTRAFPAGWNLLSVRWTPEDPSPAAVFGPAVSPLVIWTYDAGIGDYVVPEAIEPARGYWVRIPAGGATVRVVGEPVRHDVELALGAAGWHQVSAPWGIPRTAVRFWRAGEMRTWLQAVDAGWIIDRLWVYTPGEDYVDVDALEPWRGHWLHTNVRDVLMILDHSARR